MSILKTRFGIPGAISVLALVFAMLGGAYAASDAGHSGNFASEAKKKVKKGPTGPRGATGPTGAAGAQGLPGANGSDGAQGPAGPVGPTGDEGPQGPKGATGDTGPAGPLVETLPSGKTMTGAWSVDTEEEKLVTLSYPFKLAAPVATGDVVLEEEGGGETANCPGTAGDPKAASGKLCIYVQMSVLTPELGAFTFSTVGGVAADFKGSPLAFGTWAVAAP